ncbi:hypothetical protein GCM10009810_14240 [Nostocoides vanveenii]|uniref:Resolvase HTH domain-containing protein n=1 Tax=Nostocoides vanveenii TaxID=330835 RepID=A0ABN2KH07_9MICO
MGHQLRQAAGAGSGQARPSANETTQVYTLKQRLGPLVINQIVEDYARGTSSRTLAQAHGVSRHSVDVLVADSGVKQQAPKMTPEQQREAIGLYESGLSTARVGDRLGFSQSAIWLLLKRTRTTR